MAITNASDLLVYAKTASAVAQVTRIYVKTTNPFTFPDGETQARVAISNVTNASGEVTDGLNTTTQFSNTGADALTKIRQTIDTTGVSYGYQYSVQGTSGDYTYVDFTNGATGIVPTLEIVSASVGNIAIFKDDSVIVEIRTPGSSAVFDPVAFSTQASFSSSSDIRDVTTKDSAGWSESRVGLKSFEISTELLQSINPDVPLDGTDFFHELSERDEVNVAFSDRIRNILTNNLTTSGQDGFLKSSTLTQTVGQTDPFGGTTASKLITGVSTTGEGLQCSLLAGIIEDKQVTWTFYLKRVASNTTSSVTIEMKNAEGTPVISILSGPGSIVPVGGYKQIQGLTHTDWTRVSFTTEVLDMSGESSKSFKMSPGTITSQNNDSILTSSWQFELKGKASDYQDPTSITHYQGNALVSSVNYDAGVEDNLTCSATFTGTGITTLNT